MKKTVASAFLLLFLFNLGGYYLVFWGWKVNASREISMRIDLGQVTKDETVEVKIPLSLPYPIQQNNTSRASGAFEYQGTYYTLVSKRLENDTLYIMCVKDHKQKEIDQALGQFKKLAQEAPSTGNDQTVAVKLLTEFEPLDLTQIVVGLGWSACLFPHKVGTALIDLSFPVHSPPPDIC